MNTVIMEKRDREVTIEWDQLPEISGPVIHYEVRYYLRMSRENISSVRTRETYYSFTNLESKSEYTFEVGINLLHIL